LRHANRSPIDLAVLDWNLGAGNDGLQLLQDLSVFHPDIVAILVTGYAHQATPLDALRMGVRDYLDKNQGLNRETFLAAIRKQLTKIVPAKRHRELHSSLAAFRSAVEKVLPLVQSAAALNDPVPLPRAIAALSEFLRRLTGAADAVLLVRHVSADGEEQSRAWNATGEPLDGEWAPFARSLAAAALSQGDVCLVNDLSAGAGAVLQPFERGRTSLLAVPLPVGGGTQAVLELFDRPGGFRDEDRKQAAAAAEIGVELLRQALADRQTRRTLFDAVAAALDATNSATSGLLVPEAPPPAAVLDTVRASFASTGLSAKESDAMLRLAEAVRALAVRHGPPAVEHCLRVVQSVQDMLENADAP
jgi:CheY-like chemotaxis protein